MSAVSSCVAHVAAAAQEAEVVEVVVVVAGDVVDVGAWGAALDAVAAVAGDDGLVAGLPVGGELFSAGGCGVCGPHVWCFLCGGVVL